MTARAALDEAARREVEAMAAQHLARAPNGTDGRIDLVTNDYLGLRRDARVLAAATAALARSGLGAGAARLLGGDCEEHRRLEEAFARWQGEEAAVLFPTGSAANAGAIAGIVRPEDLCVSDRLNHGSLVDGIRLAGARCTVVPHLDAAAVDAALRDDAGAGRRFVIVESLHGMEGDAWDLAALAGVCRRRDALLLVDEAHAIGVRGPAAAGLVAEARCEDVVAARMNPCGKALGGAGGHRRRAGDDAARLVHASRAYAYTTALPPSVAAGVEAAVRVASQEPGPRARCRALAARVGAALAGLGERVGGLEGAFVPWILGAPETALAAAAALRERGFAARAVRPPTVPEGTARLRLSLHADLAEHETERLLAVLPEVAREARR